MPAIGVILEANEMNTRIRILTVTLLIAMPASSGAECEAIWIDLMGKGQHTYLQIDEGWPLLHYARNMPYWSPIGTERVEREINGRTVLVSAAAPTNELRWRPLSTLANVETLEDVGGFPVYEIEYAPAYKVIVWDRSDWSFCPVAIVAGNDSIVAHIYEPERVVTQDKEILHLRTQVTGTGNLQRSDFFTVQDGALIHLRVDWETVWQYRDENRIDIFHRSGGFCKGTLTWGNRAWEEDADGNPREDRGFYFRVDFEVEGDRLVPRKMALVENVDEVPSPCELYPR